MFVHLPVEITVHYPGDLEPGVIILPSPHNFEKGFDRVPVAEDYKDSKRDSRRSRQEYRFRCRFDYKHHRLDLLKLLLADEIDLPIPLQLTPTTEGYTVFKVRLTNDEAIRESLEGLLVGTGENFQNPIDYPAPQAPISLEFEGTEVFTDIEIYNLTKPTELIPIDPSPDYNYSVFLSSDIWDWEAAGEPETVDVLVVGQGGGGCGSWQRTQTGGGGGAGGVVIETGFSVNSSQVVIIGDVNNKGLQSSDSAVRQALKGQNSSFGSVVALGGGAGGNRSGIDYTLYNGGSGGGVNRALRDLGILGLGTSPQGENGGNGSPNSVAPYSSGGGGGYSEVGEDGEDSMFGGTGGDGISLVDLGWGNAIDEGAPASIGGGGGGGRRHSTNVTPASGGFGGGGNGGGVVASAPTAGQDGVANTGGGGGSAGSFSSGGGRDGGKGGSGLVIVRWGGDVVPPERDEHYTDYSEYSTGSIPSDWTRTFGTAGTWTVVSDGAATGGKVLRYTNSATGFQRKAIEWTGIGNFTNTEIHARIRFSSGYASIAEPLGGIASRISGTASSESVIYAAILRNQSYSIQEIINGSGASLETIAGVFDPNTWYEMKMKTLNNTIQVKIWLSSNPEPEEWTFMAITSLQQSSKVGLYQAFNTTTFDVDWFKVISYD